MLNLTLPTQVKTLADQPSANDASSNNARANEPTNEEFSNVLAREVSEKKGDSNKKADSEKAATPEKTTHSEKAIDPETNNSPIASEDLADAASPNLTVNPHIASTSGNLLPGTQNHEIQQATPLIIGELKPGTEVTPPITFASLSALTQNSIQPDTKKPTHAMGQTLGTTHPASPSLLQQNLMQNPLLNNNLLQTLDTADLAASGRNLSFYAEANKAIFANTGESTLSFTDSITTQQPGSGLNSFSSMLPTATAAATTALPQDISLSAQVGQPKWGNDFAQKIVWLSNQQNQVAEIRLNPAHLGPVEVMLSISSEQATAQFASPHAAVREAIEASLPRLREMMAESGIQLGNVMVGADSFQQQEQNNQHAQSSSGNGQTMMGHNGESIDSSESRASPNRHQGLVNTFA